MVTKELSPYLKPDKIIRSRRKSISIVVSHQNELILKVPMEYPLNSINKLLMDKENWIIRQRNKANEKQRVFKEFLNNNRVHFLGKHFVLVHRTGQINDVRIENDKLLITIRENISPLSVLSKWYYEQNQPLVFSLVNKYCSLLNVQFPKITITSAKTRWGSCCKGRKSISFSWKLFMAPSEVVEYVVMHEVAHLKIPNHSKDFWKQIAALMPEYKEHQVWLKNHSYLLRIDNSIFHSSIA